MIVCEAILITIIAFLGFCVTVTDMQHGVIKNKFLAAAFTMGIFVNVIYFYLYCTDYLKIYFINLCFMSALSIALYAFHFWTAGDSKLLICVTSLFPARFYGGNQLSVIPGISAVIFIFLIAYGYIIIDSLVQFLKGKKFYSGGKVTFGKIKLFFINYMICLLYLRVIKIFFQHVAGVFYYQNYVVFSFINIFIVILIYRIPILKRWYVIISVVIINGVFGEQFSWNQANMMNYAILLFVLVLRYLVSGYNYQDIPTEKVEEGMVLSYTTIMKFLPSRVQNLPQKTNEDMSTRLTKQEAEAIRRWKDSKYGEDCITVVRKIPFAFFIIAGEWTYFLIRIFR